MQRHTIDYKEILSLFLPAGLLDYFEFTDYSNMGSYYIFCKTEIDKLVNYRFLNSSSNFLILDIMASNEGGLLYIMAPTISS